MHRKLFVKKMLVVKLTYFRTTVYKQALASYKGQPEKFHTPLTSTHALRKVHESKVKTHIIEMRNC